MDDESKHPEKQALLLEMDVGVTTKFVFVALCLRADWKTLVTHPSHKDIAKICGISKRQTVADHIKILVDKDWVEHLGQRKIGKWNHNVYHIKKGITPVSNKKKKKKEIKIEVPLDRRGNPIDKKHLEGWV